MKALILMLGLFLSQYLVAQPPSRPLADLIDQESPAWSQLNRRIKKAKNRVEVLDRRADRAEAALLHAQLTTRSTLGSVVYRTGGILIDDGWLRIIGSGSERLGRSIYEWNEDKTVSNARRAPAYYLIADDAVGGFYAINGGEFGVEDMGTVYYFSPAAMQWQSLEKDYDGFLEWALNGKLDRFYGDLRWKGWRREVSELHGDEAFSFHPFLWTGDGKPAGRERQRMPVEQLYFLQRDGRHDLSSRVSEW